MPEGKVWTRCSGPPGKYRSGTGLRHRNRHPQERRRDRTNALTLSGVQALEERAQVFPHVFGTSIFFRGFERFHGFAVVVSEFVHQIGRRTGKGEIVNLPTKTASVRLVLLFAFVSPQLTPARALSSLYEAASVRVIFLVPGASHFSRGLPYQDIGARERCRDK